MTPPPATELPIKADITIYQGATLRRHWRWLAGDSPVDLSAWSGRMQIRASVTAATIMLSLTTENGGVVLSADGDIEVYATDEQTSAIPASGVYDLELEQPGIEGDVVRFVMGRATLSPEVTR